MNFVRVCVSTVIPYFVIMLTFRKIINAFLMQLHKFVSAVFFQLFLKLYCIGFKTSHDIQKKITKKFDFFKIAKSAEI